MTQHVTIPAAQGAAVLSGRLTIAEIERAMAAPATVTATVEPSVGATALLLAEQLAASGIDHSAEVNLGQLVGRKWRVDFLLPPVMIAGRVAPVVVEVDGAVHRTKERFATDRAKVRALQLLGYVVLPYTADEVRKGTAIADLQVIYAGAWGGGR